MSTGRPTLTTILKGLVSDAGLLARQELRLVQAELSQKAAQIQKGAISIVSGLLLALAALLILLQALVVALANIMPPSLAALLVGVVVAICAIILLKLGQDTLRPENLKPQRTLQSVRDHKDMISEKIS